MFRKHRRNNGDWVPERSITEVPPVVVARHTESPEAQMRIVRTHIAAQAGEMGNLRQEVREINDLLRQLLEEVRGGRLQA